MIDFKKFESKVAKYKELKAQLPNLEQSVRNIEGYCKRAIGDQWGLCRMNKHGKVVDQVTEVLRNNHAPDRIKVRLTQLNPLLTKALDDLRATKSQAAKLWHDLTDSQDSLLGQVRSEIDTIKAQIYSRLVAMLRPFTNENNACALAKETDAYKGIEFISTNLVNSSDPEVGLNMVKSALDSAKQYRALLK
jgi:hypothetical protein